MGGNVGRGCAGRPVEEQDADKPSGAAHRRRAQRPEPPPENAPRLVRPNRSDRLSRLSTDSSAGGDSMSSRGEPLPQQSH